MNGACRHLCHGVIQRLSLETLPSFALQLTMAEAVSELEHWNLRLSCPQEQVIDEALKKKQCEALFANIVRAVGGNRDDVLTEKQLECVFDGPTHGRAHQVLCDCQGLEVDEDGNMPKPKKEVTLEQW